MSDTPPVDPDDNPASTLPPDEADILNAILSGNGIDPSSLAAGYTVDQFSGEGLVDLMSSFYGTLPAELQLYAGTRYLLKPQPIGLPEPTQPATGRSVGAGGGGGGRGADGEGGGVFGRIGGVAGTVAGGAAGFVVGGLPGAVAGAVAGEAVGSDPGGTLGGEDGGDGGANQPADQIQGPVSGPPSFTEEVELPTDPAEREAALERRRLLSGEDIPEEDIVSERTTESVGDLLASFDDMALNSPAEFEDLQMSLWMGGFYGDIDIEAVNFGQPDDQSLAAWHSAIARTARFNSTGNDITVDEVIDLAKTAAGRDPDAEPTTVASDPLAVREILNRAARTELGRRLTPAEQRSAVAFILEGEKAAQVRAAKVPKVGGEVQDFDIGAQATQLVRDIAPERAAAREVRTGPFDVLRQMIGGG